MSNALFLPHLDAAAERSVSVPGIGWGEIFNVWLRASWIILPVALLGALAAFSFSFAIQPVYEAEAVLMVDRPSAGRLDNAADAPSYDAQQRAAVMRSQIEILRGSGVVRGVIDQLHLAGQPMFNPPLGRISRLLATAEDVVGFKNQLPGENATASAETRIIQSYLDHLAIRQDPDTYILHVGFRAPDPALAGRIVNAHVTNYIGWLRTQQVQAIDGAQIWLSSAVASAHARVLAAEQRVEDFSRNSSVVSLEGRTALDQGLAQLTTDLAVAQANLVKAQARADEIQRLRKSGEDAGIAALSGSKVLADLETAYAQSSATSAAVQSNFGSRNPASIQAGTRSNEIKAAITREVEHFVESGFSEANIARVTVSNLTTALDRMKQQVLGAQGARSQLARLEGEANTERAIYLSLLQKLGSYDKVDLLAKANVTILAPATVPNLPRSPQRGLLAAFGFLLAGGAAAGASVWRVNRRTVVRHTSDAMTLTGLRCVGVMPELKLKKRGSRGIDRQQLNYSFFREELRSICATLVRDHAGNGRDGVSVLVTSALPREGKSTFCYELGRFAAQSGVRVLIVHADLPSAVHRHEKGKPILVPLEGNLPFYGVEWIAPATTLGGQNIDNSLEAWRREFGLVLFDTPPSSAMAESIILAPIVDTALVLARIGQTPRSLLTGLTLQIEDAGGRIAGLVVTFAQLDTRRGVVPSDPGYYFSQNHEYHRHSIAVRANRPV